MSKATPYSEEAPSADKNRGAVYVTRPHLPPLEEFIPYLREIWDSGWLTNNGQFHQQLEAALCTYLGVEHVSLFANGTLALICALQAERITGEVITTPFSFVATSHALLWNGIQPVFADIDPHSFNLDPEKIEAAITPRTTAIMPVHVYGSPCQMAEIARIADVYGLKVIYDAAHAFGVRQNGDSILNQGDLSVLSFHATKVFTTFEGGAIVCHDAKKKARIDYLKNFGIADEVTVVAPGINAKMNEVQAAFGLLQLRHMDHVMRSRAAIDQTYRKALAGIEGIMIPDQLANVERNYSYFPVLITESFPLSRDALYQHLREHGVYARRYFYPLISTFSMYRGLTSAAGDNLPVASRVAQQVLCLPIYPDLTEADQALIFKVIRDCAEGMRS
jgi:dTDP-4-amino-4,6-dideoxygalactose transaminase